MSNSEATITLGQWAVDFIHNQLGPIALRLQDCLGDDFQKSIDILLDLLPPQRPLASGVTILFSTPDTCQAAWFPSFPQPQPDQPPLPEQLWCVLSTMLSADRTDYAGTLLLLWLAQRWTKEQQALALSITTAREQGLRPIIVCLISSSQSGAGAIGVLPLPAEADLISTPAPPTPADTIH